MDKIDIEELREELKSYYGTAAVVSDVQGVCRFLSPLKELIDIDGMSDDEIIREAERLGIL